MARVFRILAAGFICLGSGSLVGACGSATEAASPPQSQAPLASPSPSATCVDGIQLAKLRNSVDDALDIQASEDMYYGLAELYAPVSKEVSDGYIQLAEFYDTVGELMDKGDIEAANIVLERAIGVTTSIMPAVKAIPEC